MSGGWVYAWGMVRGREGMCLGHGKGWGMCMGSRCLPPPPPSHSFPPPQKTRSTVPSLAHQAAADDCAYPLPLPHAPPPLPFTEDKEYCAIKLL